jgi:PPK2 family polyphosphate:nucleotide phosphotransferase
VNRKRLRKLVDRYRVEDGKSFRLKRFDPADTADDLVDKRHSETLLADGVRKLAGLQRLLAAQDEWGVLAVFQGMDASGKDGTISHVMSGVNPQGVRVTSFKQPSADELAHDYLWRIMHALPRRGEIGIFNRSHYEEVLTVRLHPKLLARQNLPPSLTGKKIWWQRLEDIASFEQYLTRQGIVILKFFLHMSKAEQKSRFLARLDSPEKNWKFSADDIAERGYWDDYQDAYAEAIAATSGAKTPWFVVPADHKWFCRLVVVEAIVAALEDLYLKPPKPGADAAAMLADARRRLEAE